MKALLLFLNSLGKFPNKGMPPKTVSLRLPSSSLPPSFCREIWLVWNRSFERGHLKSGGVFVLSHSGREGRADLPTSHCLPAQLSYDTVTSSPLACLSLPQSPENVHGECVICGAALSVSCMYSALPLSSGAP